MKDILYGISILFLFCSCGISSYPRIYPKDGFLYTYGGKFKGMKMSLVKAVRRGNKIDLSSDTLDEDHIVLRIYDSTGLSDHIYCRDIGHVWREEK
jgi:hypothetical protein